VTAIRLSKRFIIEGTTFEHGGVAVQNRDHYLRNCVFRDLDEAVAEGGCLGARLVNCTFEGNRANWSLGSLSSRGIVLTDCTLGPQKEPVRVAKNSAPLSFLTPRSLSVYPACSECASLIVKVLDAAGKPVPNAVVLVSCEDDPQEITRGATFTDDRGLTPSDAETDAIVITTRKYRATEDPNRPQQATFGYKVSVAKAGFRPKTLKLPAGRPIRRPLVVRLESQTATASPAQAARTWTDSTGKYRIQATLLDFDGKVVRLKRPDGKTIALPLEKLSESDREYIRSQANE
jgi:hypothetical protein